MLCNARKVYIGRLAQLVRALRSHRLDIIQHIESSCIKRSLLCANGMIVRKSAQQFMRNLRYQHLIKSHTPFQQIQPLDMFKTVKLAVSRQYVGVFLSNSTKDKQP